MKKRIALAAAIALAISVGGMVPAFAAKPSAPASSLSPACARTTTALEVRDSAAITVKVVNDALVLTGTTACDGGLYSGYGDFTGLTAVTIKSNGAVTFELEDGGDAVPGTNVFANYHNVAFTVQTSTELKFLGTGLANTFYAITGNVSEESFTFGTLTGTYYAGSKLSFYGGAADDSFDASTVTTTRVFAYGANGADTLKGGALADTLQGQDGNDVLYGNAGDDSLDATAGDVSPVTCYAGKSDNPKPCVSTNGSDQAWGGAGNDNIVGDGGDTVAPGDGNDYVTGNISMLNYSDSSAAVTIDLDSKPHYVTSTAGTDFFGGSVATYVGSNFGDTFVGTANPDDFRGLDGADTVVTYAGADVIYGGGGADAIKGGEGNDTISGDSGPDKINGGADDDSIRGYGGDDIIYGSTGDDFILGGKGTDQAWGGRGIDTCGGEVTDSCEFTR